MRRDHTPQNDEGKPSPFRLSDERYAEFVKTMGCEISDTITATNKHFYGDEQAPLRIDATIEAMSQIIGLFLSWEPEFDDPQVLHRYIQTLAFNIEKVVMAAKADEVPRPNKVNTVDARTPGGQKE